MAEPYLGQIIMFGGNFAIRGFAECSGQLLPISQNTALFSLLGTIYGGDGRTTFALPDLRGRSPMHFGNGPGLSDRRIGSKGGFETETLSVSHIPSHNHSVTAKMHGTNSPADVEDVESAAFSNAGSDQSVYAEAIPEDTLVDMNAQTISTAEQNVGGNLPHNNMHPYIAINFQIALQGIFPSRS